MTKVESITLFANDKRFAKLTPDCNRNLSFQSRHLEFSIDKTGFFSDFDFYESYPNNQYRIGLLEAKVTIDIEIEIDSENQEFEIKGRAKDVEIISDLGHYASKMNTYKLRKCLVEAINNPHSSFYYDIDAEVEFVEEDL